MISYDRQNLTNNIFGNYKYSLFKNDSLDFEFTFDSFSFPEKPIQKEFVDYEFFVLNKSRIVKLFSNKEKKLRFVSKNSNGIIINENEKVEGNNMFVGENKISFFESKLPEEITWD